MKIKSKLAKGAIAGGVLVGLFGVGAGVASADPGPDQRPAAEQQQGHDQQRDEHQGQQRPDQHQDQQRPAPQPAGHGFWLFGQWIPLP
ncbi:hypothetical protein [Nocardia nepalensis]|uniref:hypothetical protein n=1 Tax=Nocardia nepalensis TaxID=3375448 RepID=UPI003B676391